jgi:hypothetical protein
MLSLFAKRIVADSYSTDLLPPTNLRSTISQEPSNKMLYYVHNQAAFSGLPLQLVGFAKQSWASGTRHLANGRAD